MQTAKLKINIVNNKLRTKCKKVSREVWKHRELYIFMLPALAAVIIFSYIPIYGIQMAFKDVKIGQTISEGAWVGLKNFMRLFNAGYFSIIMKNTIFISVFNNFLTLPIPIVLAVMMHNCINTRIRKFAQTATYLPYLLSTVVIVSILNMFCSGEYGLINIILRQLGQHPISFFGKEAWVMPLYVLSGIWQYTGYSAIIYLAALSTVDSQLIEAAIVDGASKLKRIWHIDLSTIKPTIIILLILSMGRVFGIGVDKMLLLQTDLNLNASEIIATYVYKTGIVSAQYGFSTAVGMFNNVINFIFLLTVNYLSKKLTETSLF